MLLDFLETQAQRLADRLPKPDTKEAWLRRADELRPRLLHSLGLARFPDRHPLVPQVVGAIERPAYRIEKLVYEPRPGFRVSAHLYLPRQAAFPAPAVLYSPGHWMENGKLEPDVQTCCANLARLGLVVLVYDPIGQGERLGDWLDHGHLEPLLVGLSQAGLMVWESMRAIDYLAGRPEVDPQRIGMTGASGGGLNTVFTSAVDERIQASVPVCFVNTFLSMMTAQRDRNWEDGVDLCNQVPGVMAYAEMSDVCGLFAPRPLCVIAAVRDWMFPIQAVRQAARDIQRLYALLGAGQQVRLVEVDAEHGYDRAMRQAAYGWLVRWLKGEGDGHPIPEVEPELLPAPYHPALTYIAPPDPADLAILRGRRSLAISSPGLCFAEGAAPPPGPAITALARQAAQALPPARPLPGSAEDWARQRRDLLDQVQHLLGPIPERTLVADRITHQALHRGYFFERVVFESEPGIDVPALFVAPADWKAYLPVVIYVDEWGKENGLSHGVVELLVKRGCAVFAVDVRGVGETAATDFEATTNALMMDRPLFGQRVYDVLRAVDCLWRRIYIGVQIDKGRIACLGRGVGGLLALYAAALDERIAAAAVHEAPLSYQDLILEQPAFPPGVFLFDVLNHYDLVHVAALAAPRPLLLADGVDGLRRPVPRTKAEQAYGWCRDVYRRLEAESGFSMMGAAGDATLGHIADWLAAHLRAA
jgi:cephalosporin-C deacetylase-like acetyl esterase